MVQVLSDAFTNAYQALERMAAEEVLNENWRFALGELGEVVNRQEGPVKEQVMSALVPVLEGILREPKTYALTHESKIDHEWGRGGWANHEYVFKKKGGPAIIEIRSKEQYGTLSDDSMDYGYGPTREAHIAGAVYHCTVGRKHS